MSSSDLDELLALVDDLRFREQRQRELEAEFAAARSNHTPALATFADEPLLMAAVQELPRACVVCFFLPLFERCVLMRKRLGALAGRYPLVSFFEIDATKAPFLVTKLQVKVLPVVVVYAADGSVMDRWVGFERLDPNPEGTLFREAALEEALQALGVITRTRPPPQTASHRQTIRDDGSDSDLDL